VRYAWLDVKDNTVHCKECAHKKGPLREVKKIELKELDRSHCATCGQAL